MSRKKGFHILVVHTLYINKYLRKFYMFLYSCMSCTTLNQKQQCYLNLYMLATLRAIVSRAS